MNQDIASAFEQMESLKAMLPRQSYALPVNDQTLQGPKEVFLRRRTAREIQNSGLSSGCGDYAFVFLNLMEQRGYQTLLVDSAAVSTLSLANHFAGHTVVAVRRNDASDWCLVDATSRKILEVPWNTGATSFRVAGRTFWVGYCGPLGHYSVCDAASLRAFYKQALSQIPRDVLNATLLCLTFVVDDSLKGTGDNDGNPSLPDFLKCQSEVFARYDLSPQTKVTVRLMAGEDDAVSRIVQVETGHWVATVGRKSACTLSLLDYFERSIARQLRCI